MSIESVIQEIHQLGFVVANLWQPDTTNLSQWWASVRAYQPDGAPHKGVSYEWAGGRSAEDALRNVLAKSRERLAAVARDAPAQTAPSFNPLD